MKNTFLNEQVTKEALARFILTSNRLSMGDNCADFEQAFAQYQGSADAVLFNSGGSANLAMLQALLNRGKVKTGAKVGFSALTWSTNVMPILQLGMIPVAIDCSIDTINVMSANIIETLKTEKIEVFFSTNVLGLAGDLQTIKELCEAEGIIYIEDNCESLGTELEGGKTGTFGLASSFSFFVAHHMSTIEGGMVCTDDEEFAEMLRIVRANGWDRNLKPEQQIKWRRQNGIKSEFDAKYSFYDLGYNLRPTEITGFLGLEQLKYLEDNINQREKNFAEIDAVASKNSDLIKIKTDHILKVSSFSMPFICKSKELRDQYVYQFSGAGIEIRPIISGNMQNQPFYKKYVKNMQNVDSSETIYQNGFYCGNYPELTKSDLATIAVCVSPQED
ncbi:MAG: DegT/DnrJ/EryC1/StrS aminotransferase family protein [Flavobacteriales bacterium]|nr:DegT/DnrJ/EryC1/StrS aminotransferase family protein [Flavobacteriales bacterium]